MDFIFYVGAQLAFAATGFAALFAMSAAAVWWKDRHKRAHYRYWNGRS